MKAKFRLTFGVSLLIAALWVSAAEVWLSPIPQNDTGGLGTGQMGTWATSPYGVTRFLWAIPLDAISIQRASILLAPAAPSGPGTLSIIYCVGIAQTSVSANCTWTPPVEFLGIQNQLTEIDLTGILPASALDANMRPYVSIMAFTQPTTETDHFVGMRITYDTQSPPQGPAGPQGPVGPAGPPGPIHRT
jgi:hypothetical protein